MALESSDFGIGPLDLSALDSIGRGGAQVAAYGGAADLGIGGGPTGVGGFSLGLDRGRSAEGSGGLSMQGTGLPSIGQPSSLGGKIGTGVAALMSALGLGLPGFAAKEALTYGPGVFNSITGRAGGSPLGPGGMPAPGEARGGLLGGLSPGPGMGAAGNAGGFGNLDPRSQMQLLALLQMLQQGQGGGFFNPTGWPTQPPAGY